MENEEVVFTIILHAGSARSFCFEALALAREDKFNEAAERIAEAKKELNEAHRMQTTLLQSEAGGEKHEVNLLLIHAQDHLMTAILAKDLIQEMISMLQEKHL